MPAPRTPGRPGVGPPRGPGAASPAAGRGPSHLTPAQAAGLVAAAAANRTGAPGDAGRPRSPPGRRPTTRSEARSAPRPGTATAPLVGPPRVVALSTLLLPAAAVLALPGAGGDGPGGPVDTTESRCPRRPPCSSRQAATARSSSRSPSARPTWPRRARVVATVEAQVAAQQQILGACATTCTVRSPSQRYPLLGLSVHDQGRDRRRPVRPGHRGTRRSRPEDRRAAQRTVLALEEARRQAAEAEADVAEALEQADGVLPARPRRGRGS